MTAEQRRLKSALGPAGASLKCTRPDSAHLTLAFLAHVDDERVRPLLADAARDINRSAFEIALAGIGVFPGRGAPRVLWIGVGAGADALLALQRDVAARIAARGIALEGP